MIDHIFFTSRGLLKLNSPLLYILTTRILGYTITMPGDFDGDELDISMPHIGSGEDALTTMHLDLAENDLLSFLRHLGMIRIQTLTLIESSTSLLSPLAEIVAGYATIDPRIAVVLIKRVIHNPQHKLSWRVKHRDDPSGPDVAEISITFNRALQSQSADIIRCMTIGTFRLDRHNGETCRGYLYQLNEWYLCHDSGSDGVTIRLNDREAIFSNSVAEDMHAIALAGLHRMIGAVVGR